jgi:hypothetical protein
VFELLASEPAHIECHTYDSCSTLVYSYKASPKKRRKIKAICGNFRKLNPFQNTRYLEQSY